MSEEQKMEEGKRMFSIFAARMFEQRVLQAYREKVAQERQLQLLRELDDEDKITKDREMKRQNQNQKKKDKKRYAIAPFLLFRKSLKGFATLGSRSRLRKRNVLLKLRIRLLKRLRLRLGRLLLTRKVGRDVKMSVWDVRQPREQWMKKRHVRKKIGRSESRKIVNVSRSENGKRRKRRIRWRRNERRERERPKRNERLDWQRRRRRRIV
jgi:hypothetical protein